MKTIRYGLHFSILSVAAAIFWLARNVDFPAQIISFRIVHYGMMGALHATSIVVSLRDRKVARAITTLCFISLAATWSAATPILGLWASFVWLPVLDILPRNEFNALFLLLSGSVVGASGYWMLLRLFWLKSLRRTDWLRTVGLCITATSLAVFALGLAPHSTDGDVADLVLTAAWWFAFSISLYWSEVNGYDEKSDELQPSLS